jgi:hypothetical protein
MKDMAVETPRSVHESWSNVGRNFLRNPCRSKHEEGEWAEFLDMVYHPVEGVSNYDDLTPTDYISEQIFLCLSQTAADCFFVTNLCISYD